MTEPTNKELDAVIKHYRTRIYPQDMQPHFERAIMRAVLAKWGTPAPVGVEPVATVGSWTNGNYSRNYRITRHRDVPAGTQLHTAPQPTQAQAGAVPLTDEQSHALLERMATEADQWAEGLSYEPTREQLSGWCVAFIQREIQAAHGIKGGQHGTE